MPRKEVAVMMGWPPDFTWYKLLTDWGSLIGGFLALIAGATAYIAGHLQARATRQAAEMQIAAVADKDRLQAQCIAAGILPELYQIEAALESARSRIDDVETAGYGTSIIGEGAAREIAVGIRSARIDIPPTINRSLDHLYMLGRSAGPTFLQLFSLILQYDDLIERYAHTLASACNLNTLQLRQETTGHFQHIKTLIDDAQRQLRPLYDAASETTEPTRDMSTPEPGRRSQ